MRKRLKEFCDYISRGAAPDYVDESPYKVMNQATFSKGYIDESNVRFSSKAPEYAQIHKGDLLMASTGGGVLGKVAYFDKDENDFYADSHVSILRNSKGINSMKFLYYWFSTRYDEINATMVKGSTNQTELQRNYLVNYEIDIPSLSVQQRIVSYLDDKTAKIDKAVSLLQKKRDAYTRLKASIINRAVTRGLNPNVKLKDSGVEWIGMIPEGWEVKAFKRFMNINNGCDYKHIIADEGYPVIGSGGVFEHASQYLYDGEVLLLGRKGTIDKPMYFKDKFWTVDTMFYCIPNKDVSCKYVYYQALIVPLLKYSTQTALPSMTQTSLYNISYCVPPLSEQRAIASYLDTHCTRIDHAISIVDKQIAAYTRLKRSLINEVVTGKRKV